MAASKRKRQRVAGAALACLLGAARVSATESSLGITEGTDAEVATEPRTWNGGTSHFEAIVSYPSAHTAMNHDHVDVAVTNTAVRILSDDTVCRHVAITADDDNSTFVVVGKSSVTTSNGYRLYPGSAVVVEPPDGSDCGDIWLNGTANDGVSVLAK